VVNRRQQTTVLSALVTLVVITLSGCGASEGGLAAPTRAPVPASSPALRVMASGENWSFRTAGYEDQLVFLGATYISTRPIASLDGALDLSGTSITAVMAVLGGCINDKLPRFAGTRDGLEIDMVSAPISGVTIRVTGALSADMRSFKGTYSATGACRTAGPQPMTGRRIELDGVWSDSTVTLTVTLATMPTEQGSFALTGTLAFANNPCLPDGHVSNIARGRLLFPEVISGRNMYVFDNEVTPDLKQMPYEYVLSQGSCLANRAGRGTLVRR
jgi:hypothetical protein